MIVIFLLVGAGIFQFESKATDKRKNNATEMLLAKKVVDKELGLFYYFAPERFYQEEIQKFYNNFEACQNLKSRIWLTSSYEQGVAYCKQLALNIKDITGLSPTNESYADTLSNKILEKCELK